MTIRHDCTWKRRLYTRLHLEEDDAEGGDGDDGEEQDALDEMHEEPRAVGSCSSGSRFRLGFRLGFRLRFRV